MVRSFLSGLHLCNLFFPSTRRLPEIAYPCALGEVKRSARITGIEACANATVDPSFLRVAVTFALDPPFAVTAARQRVKAKVNVGVGDRADDIRDRLETPNKSPPDRNLRFAA
jgi:hypothetical protein